MVQIAQASGPNGSNRCLMTVDGRRCGARPHRPYARYCRHHASGGTGPAPTRAEAAAPGQSAAASPLPGVADPAAFGHELGALLHQTQEAEQKQAVQALIAEDAAREARIQVAARAKFNEWAATSTDGIVTKPLGAERRRELLGHTATGRAILAREDAATRQAAQGKG